MPLDDLNKFRPGTRVVLARPDAGSASYGLAVGLVGVVYRTRVANAFYVEVRFPGPPYTSTTREWPMYPSELDPLP